MYLNVATDDLYQKITQKVKIVIIFLVCVILEHIICNSSSTLSITAIDFRPMGDRYRQIPLYN